MLLMEALAWLAASRAAILTIPFKYLAPRLGALAGSQDSPEIENLPSYNEYTARTTWAVEAMSRWAPWECKCLVQAITGKMMLRRRGVPSSLFLGVRKNESGGLEAHAWLKCGDVFVTGEPGHETFTVVSSFTDSPSGFMPASGNMFKG